jgi:hypothetical protein
VISIFSYLLPLEFFFREAALITLLITRILSEGVVRTRVGYCGGSSAKATFLDIGELTEAIQLDFIPSKISYETILSMEELLLHSLANASPPQMRSGKIIIHKQARISIAVPSSAIPTNRPIKQRRCV